MADNTESRHTKIVDTDTPSPDEKPKPMLKVEDIAGIAGPLPEGMSAADLAREARQIGFRSRWERYLAQLAEERAVLLKKINFSAGSPSPHGDCGRVAVRSRSSIPGAIAAGTHQSLRGDEFLPAA